ncbi:MAG: hypothetical protein J7K54_03670 [Candidatus Aenigmarchaeota archaeon]|nr:hypothetical protein [Candidatus Aenigmarchaeota archaeon]
MKLHPTIYSPMHLGDIAKAYREISSLRGKEKEKALEMLEHFEYSCRKFPKDTYESAYMNKFRLTAKNLANSTVEIDRNYEKLKDNLEKEYREKTENLMSRSTAGQIADGVRDVAVGFVGYGATKILERVFDIEISEEARMHLPYVVGIASGWLSNKIEKVYKTKKIKKIWRDYKTGTEELEHEKKEKKNQVYTREINKIVHVYNESFKMPQSEKELLSRLYEIDVFNGPGHPN